MTVPSSVLSSTDTTPYGLNAATQTVTVTVDQGTPVVASATPADPSSSTGIVTGITAFTNTAGRTLTYSTAGSSAGGRTVSVNPTTGAFTYTPSESMRQDAGGSTTDTFTDTASNGVRTVTQTITVPVS